MRDVLELIEEVLVERGWSARQASIEAVGTPNFISHLRRGQVPSVVRLRALCEVLGLEFYVGRPRRTSGADIDIVRLALALEEIARAFPDAGERLGVHDRAQLLAAVYTLLDERDPVGSAARVRDLVAMARRFGVAEAV